MWYAGVVVITKVIVLWVVLYIIDKLTTSRYKVLLLRPKSIPLGTLTTYELTLFEFKPLCSIKLFYFLPGRAQEIFHNHSFHALSFRFFGNYMERFIDLTTGAEWELPRNRARIIYIARDKFHQITQSAGCLTLMVTGPWGDTYEEFDGVRTITSTHGRRIVK